MKTYVVGTHLNHLDKMVQMSTHNICFHWKIRKIILQWSAIYSSYLVYWQVKQCPNKTYSLQILNYTARAKIDFFFAPHPHPLPPHPLINHHTTFLDREGIVLSFVPWSLIMLLMQIKLIYNRWKLDLIPLLFSLLYINA